MGRGIPWLLLLATLLSGCQTGYLGGGTEYEMPFRAELLANRVSGRPGEVVEVPFRILPTYSGPDLIVCSWITAPDGSPSPQVTPESARLSCSRFSSLAPIEGEGTFQIAPEATPGTWPLVLHLSNEVSRNPLPFTLEVRP